LSESSTAKSSMKPQQTPASGDTNSRFVSKLLEYGAL
jgi:hypothetical protein